MRSSRSRFCRFASVISFTADPVEGCDPLVVTFQNTTDPQFNGTCDWDFGDGNTASGATLNTRANTYPDPGTYTVTLTVADDDGDCQAYAEAGDAHSHSANHSCRDADSCLLPAHLDTGLPDAGPAGDGDTAADRYPIT